VWVEEQGGVRLARQPEQVFALADMIKMRPRQRKHTHSCCIDIEKMWRAGLKERVRHYSIHGCMYAVLCSLYTERESTIRLRETVRLH